MAFTNKPVKCARLSADAIIALVVSLLSLLFDEGVFGGPAKRGYFRDDQSISYPYVEDETVSTGLLIVLTFIIPLLVIPAIDACVWMADKRAGEKVAPGAEAAWATFHRVWAFWLGFGLTVFFTAMVKDTVGRLRPDFLARCQPDYSGIAANETFITGRVSSIVCTGDAAVVEKGRRSFPSGHSSTAFYGLGFLAWYIGQAVPKRLRCSQYCVTLFQFPLVALATWIAASRTIDYAHHAWDVVAGSTLGAVVAAFIALVLLRDYASDDDDDEQAVLPTHVGGSRNNGGGAGQLEMRPQAPPTGTP